MKFLTIAIPLLLGVSAHATSIEIDADKDDCTAGWISMDVKVTVDGEEFKFEVTCEGASESVEIMCPADRK